MSRYYSHLGVLNSALACAKILAGISEWYTIPERIRSVEAFIDWVKTIQSHNQTTWIGSDIPDEPFANYNTGTGTILIKRKVGNHSIEVDINDHGDSDDPSCAGSVTITFWLSKGYDVLILRFYMTERGNLFPDETQVSTGIEPSRQQRALRLIKKLVEALPTERDPNAWSHSKVEVINLYEQMKRKVRMLPGYLALPYGEPRKQNQPNN